VQGVSYFKNKIPIFILKNSIRFVRKEQEANVQNINSILSDLRYIYVPLQGNKLFIGLCYRGPDGHCLGLPEKLPIVQPFRKFPAILRNPEGSSPCSQEPSTGPYPEPVRSGPYHPILSLLRSILILSTHLRIGLLSGLFPSGFPTNILYELFFSSTRATCLAHLATVTGT
jgi:hypothetical protein